MSTIVSCNFHVNVNKTLSPGQLFSLLGIFLRRDSPKEVYLSYMFLSSYCLLSSSRSLMHLGRNVMKTDSSELSLKAWFTLLSFSCGSSLNYSPFVQDPRNASLLPALLRSHVVSQTLCVSVLTLKTWSINYKSYCIIRRHHVKCYYYVKQHHAVIQRRRKICSGVCVSAGRKL